MKKFLAVAGAALMFAPVVFVHKAIAFQQPKRGPALPSVLWISPRN